MCAHISVVIIAKYIIFADNVIIYAIMLINSDHTETMTLTAIYVCTYIPSYNIGNDMSLHDNSLYGIYM